MTVEPFFLDGSAGRLFALLIRPDEAQAGSGNRALMYCPPFAEEANRTRRAAVLLGHRLADLGIATFIVDPYATGDSDGEFSQARLETWREDVSVAAQWLTEQGLGRLSLLGVRLGASIAGQFAAQPDRRLEHLVLWQPVVKGSGFLTQFLRLRTAHSLIASGEGTSTKELRAKLAAGESLEVAGYRLSPELSADIDGIELSTNLVPAVDCVTWLEIAAGGRDAISVPSQAIIDRWTEAGVSTSARAVNGPRYWETQEITIPQEMIEATVQVLQSAT